MSEISLYSHLVEKRAKRIFSRRMCMVFGFGLNHTSEFRESKIYGYYEAAGRDTGITSIVIFTILVLPVL